MATQNNNSAPRVVCFIDGSNLYSHLRDVFGSGKVAIDDLCEHLAGPGRRLVKWRFYAAPLPQGSTPYEQARYAGQQRFFRFVQRERRGELRLGKFQRDSDGTLHEKGVDTMLAIDLVKLAAENKYEVAIVLSGDADLVPAVDMVRTVYRKRVEMALPNVPAFHLRQTVDAYVEITRGMFEMFRR